VRSFALPYGHRRRHAKPVPDTPALAASSLSAGYPGSTTLALRDVSLKIPVGAKVALVGPNGSGKSTLLKVVCGLLTARAGEVSVFGNAVGTCHHRVAYLPQRGELDWRFPVSVRRLVMGGRYVHLGWIKRPAGSDRRIVEEVMERLGIADLAGRRIGELSGGQRQRALLARALAQQSDLLLLDEPMTAVDAETRVAISSALSELRESGKTIVVATHDLESLASEFDGALCLRDGREARPQPGAFVGFPVGRSSWTG
jgi:ABC-type Mn2+/Zn2+ transport system ATPase subunit